MRRSFICLAAVLALGACRAEGGHGSRNGGNSASAVGPRRDVLGVLPKMPKAVLRDTLGTTEAQNQKYSTLAAIDTVVEFYRHALDSIGFQVQGDQSSDGQFTIYATKDSSAVWLRAWSEPPVTMYTLIGTTIRPGTQGDTVAIRPRQPTPRP